MATANRKPATPKIVVLDAEAIKELVDKVGLLKAHLAPQLETLEADLKKLKEQGVGIYTGRLYEVNVFEKEDSRLDMDAVRAKLSHQFITANTTTKIVRVGKVSARKQVEV